MHDCRECGVPLTQDNTYGKNRHICKLCHRERVYARRDAIRAKGICILCGDRPAEPESPTCAECKKNNLQRYYDNKPAYLQVARDRRQRLKRAALDAYGGPRCICCGEVHVEFLTIDHVDGTGADHRRALQAERGWRGSSSQMAGSHMYLWLKQNNYPPGFRVLCFNCNFALGHHGYCPHHPVLAAISQSLLGKE